MIARELRFDGGEAEIPVAHALDHALNVAPVVVAGLLRSTGELDRLERAYDESIAAVAGPEAAERVRAVGLSRLHEVCTPPEVAAIVADLDDRVRPHTLDLARALVDQVAPDARGRYFVGNRTSVRAMVPYEVLAAHPELAAGGYLDGHVRPIGRHVDVEVTHPHRCVVAWGAVGPVRAGNTVAIHPPPGAAPGPPLTPALDPGDLLLFSADLPHESVVNETDETRVGIGVRIVPGRRLRYGVGHHWRPYTYVGLVDTPFAALATARSRCTVAAWRRWRWRRRWEREQLRATGTIPALTKR